MFVFVGASNGCIPAAFCCQAVRGQNSVRDVSLMCAGPRAVGRRRSAALPHHGDMWKQGKILWRSFRHILVCAGGARQRLFFSGRASLGGPGSVEASSVVCGRCKQTFSGGACESATKPTAEQIEKSERDQEEPTPPPTSWPARRFQDEPTKA